MKARILFFFMLVIVNCFATNNIVINQSYTTNTTIQPFGSINNASSIMINGSVILNTDTSLVRIILTDNNGIEYLIFESYSMIVDKKSYSFSNNSDETLLLNNIKPISLKIIVVNSTLNIENISIDETAITSTFADTEKKRKSIIEMNNQLKASKINTQIKMRYMRWIAGVPEIANCTFSQKRDLFGGSDSYNTYGFEYQVAGVFATPHNWITPKLKADGTPDTPNLIYTYDVRNLHGSLDKNSPYYNQNSKQGWLTTIKHQNFPVICGCCWAFTAVAVTEGLTNLYYNRHLDIDLSEQQVISCTGGNNSAKVDEGGGGFEQKALDYIADKGGLVDENCWQYTGTDLPCKDLLNYNVNVKITHPFGIYDKTQVIWYKWTLDKIKKAIVKYGPLAAHISTHAMALIGWRDYDDKSTVWIFKDSDPIDESGLRLVNGNDIIGVYGTSFLSCNLYMESDRVCVDMDGDGYYNWGIGQKPTTCPICAPDIEDANDWSKDTVTIDEYGKPTPFTTKTTDIDYVTTSQTYTNVKEFCGDLVIKNNSTLTINASGKIKMQASHKITIESGSKLIINGGVTSMASIIVNNGANLQLNAGGVIEICSPVSLIVNGTFNQNLGEVKIVNPFAAK